MAKDWRQKFATRYTNMLCPITRNVGQSQSERGRLLRGPFTRTVPDKSLCLHAVANTSRPLQVTNAMTIVHTLTSAVSPALIHLLFLLSTGRYFAKLDHSGSPKTLSKSTVKHSLVLSTTSPVGCNRLALRTSGLCPDSSYTVVLLR